MPFLGQKEFTLITADYRKFFDSFDPAFFCQLCIAIGIPARVSNLVCFMNTSMKRVVKIGRSYGTPFTVTIGAGQGDSFSVICALAITTIQFRLINRLHPTIRLTSVVDDRTFRGNCMEAINAVKTAMVFDKTVGLVNQLDKFGYVYAY